METVELKFNAPAALIETMRKEIKQELKEELSKELLIEWCALKSLPDFFPGLAAATFRRWRRNNILPGNCYRQMGKIYLYNIKQINKFIEKNK